MATIPELTTFGDGLFDAWRDRTYSGALLTSPPVATIPEPQGYPEMACSSPGMRRAYTECATDVAADCDHPLADAGMACSTPGGTLRAYSGALPTLPPVATIPEPRGDRRWLVRRLQRGRCRAYTAYILWWKGHDVSNGLHRVDSPVEGFDSRGATASPLMQRETQRREPGRSLI